MWTELTDAIWLHQQLFHVVNDESVAWTISLAGRALSTRIERGLAPHGIGRGEYRILFALYEEEGRSQTELAEQYQLNKGVITRVVKRLVEKGYVKRQPDPEDKRRKLLYLTDEAEVLRSEVRNLQATVEDELARGLTDEERRALVYGLQTAVKNLGVPVNKEGSR